MAFRLLLHREKRLARIKLILLEAGERWLTSRQVAAKLKPGVKTDPDSVRDDLLRLRDLREVESRICRKSRPALEWRLA